MPHVRCAANPPRATPCRLAFVGEAPGETEMEDGSPLVGPSGRVFNQLLRTANIEREDCLVTNVFDTQAPDNDPMAWTVSRAEALSKGWPLEHDCDGRYFDPEFLRYNLDRLGAELRQAAPTVIVPMGGTACWAFTGKLGVTQARGAVCRATRVSPGTKLVPTLHPAYVIRQWKMFHVVAADMMKADAEAARGPAVTYTEREIWIEPRLDDLSNFERRYMHSSILLSVDIETMPAQRHITCVGVAPDATHALVIPFVDWRRPSRSYWKSLSDEMEAWKWLRRWLESPIPKLMQNGTYDFTWLYDMGIHVRNYCEDTRLLHHALYPEMPKDLGFMGRHVRPDRAVETGTYIQSLRSKDGKQGLNNTTLIWTMVSWRGQWISLVSKAALPVSRALICTFTSSENVKIIRECVCVETIASAYAKGYGLRNPNGPFYKGIDGKNVLYTDHTLRIRILPSPDGSWKATVYKGMLGVEQAGFSTATVALAWASTYAAFKTNELVHPNRKAGLPAPTSAA